MFFPLKASARGLNSFDHIAQPWGIQRIAVQHGIYPGGVLSQVSQPYPGFQQQCVVAGLQFSRSETDFVQHVPKPISTLCVPRGRGAASGCAADQQSQPRAQQVAATVIC